MNISHADPDRHEEEQMCFTHTAASSQPKTLTWLPASLGSRENFPLISFLAPAWCGHSLKVDGKEGVSENENKAPELR